MSKKGISPLIATVLLIGFTVALVLVVTTWGSDYLKDILSSTEKSTNIALKCSPPYLEFDTRVNCDTGKFTIMNRGTNDIVKFRIIPDEGDPIEIDRTTEPLAGGDITSPEGLPISGRLDVVAFIAGTDGKEIPCAQAAQEVIVNCEVL